MPTDEPHRDDARDRPVALAQLDAGALARLRALDPDGRLQVLPRVLQAYESSLVQMLDGVVVACLDSDWATLERMAHTLKSSSASVGALAFSGHCEGIERRLREGRADGIGEALVPLEAEGRRVLAAVQAMLRSP